MIVRSMSMMILGVDSFLNDRMMYVKHRSRCRLGTLRDTK